MLNHVPLFTGINGFGLAAEWMGWNQPFHCEIDEFCQKIIQFYWPNSIPYYDIKKTDFTKHRGTVDVLSGGFPCQGFSVAGLRQGTTDHRFLWPEMRRAYNECKPTWIVGENVTGIFSMEDKREVSKDVFFKVEGRKITRLLEIDDYEAIYIRQAKMLIESICQDLEKDGYEVYPIVIPAASVQAPHKRDRTWIIAYNPNARIENMRQKRKDSIHESAIVADSHNNGPHGTENRQSYREGNDNNKAGKNSIKQPSGCGSKAITPNPNSDKRQKRRMHKEGQEKAKRHTGALYTRKIRRDWENFPTQSPLCFRNDGISTKLDGITFPKFRNESIKGAGNAIVPQVAFEIFKIIDQLTLDSY